MEMIDQFRAKFIEESSDNIRDLEEALLLLEGDMGNKELIERSFRAMHSIKGGSSMFGFNRLSEFTHHLETIYDGVRKGNIPVTTELITFTFYAIDQISYLLRKGDDLSDSDIQNLNSFIKKTEVFINGNSADNLDDKQSQDVNSAENESKSWLITFVPNEDLLKNGTNPFFLLDDIHALGKAVTMAFTDKIPTFDVFEHDKCYVSWQAILCSNKSINEIKDVFIFVEDDCELHIELIADGSIIEKEEIKQIIQKALSTNSMLSVDEIKKNISNVSEIKTQEKKKKADLSKEHKIASIRVASSKIDELVTLVSELVITQSQLSLYAEHHSDSIIESISESIQKLSRQLRDNAFNISLIPLQSELMRFQRLVRDLSKEQNKEIDFSIEGSEIELDKTIIENLTDPLLHILRNSVDHGIESKEERIAAGKSPKGNIFFKAYNLGANVMIEISDDGKGVDTEVIRAKAINAGLIEPDAKPDDSEILELLFTSGFSTRTVVTDLSGRGVGLDVVKRKIEGIRGKVSIDSVKGQGTIISIRLPLTLSIIDGLLIKVAKNNYVVPISAIETIFPVEYERKDTSFNYVVTINDEQVPYIDLRDIFQEPLREKTEPSQMILIRIDDRKLGIISDEVVGEYQTVVKPLGRYLERQGYLSGASILGDGTIAFVLDTSSLLNARKIKKEAIKETKLLTA